MIIVHVGLPKTATTFLQYRIFKPSFGPGFRHRKTSDGLCAAIRKFVHGTAEDTGMTQGALQDALMRLPTEPTILTDECISMIPDTFWNANKMIRPGDVAQRLAEVTKTVRRERPVRVLVGFRQPDQWFASWYAYCSKWRQNFSQRDFDGRMAEIASAPQYEWASQAHVMQAFRQVLGDDAVAAYTMEDVRDRLPSVLDSLSEIVGIPMEASEQVMLNKNSTADNTWTMFNDQPDLVLTEQQSQDIRAAYLPAVS